MSQSLLRVSNLEKHYRLGRDTVPVLEGLNMDLAAGEMVVIMGPSGAGKTTLLNCISGIDTGDAGDIRVAGQSLMGLSESKRTLIRRRDIGMVFQFFNLIPTLTVRENIGLPFMIMKQRDKASSTRIDEMIEMVGLEHRSNHYSHQLSGGEMQLVSIARALVHRPPLLLADEPTGNVNPAVGRNIMDILRRLTGELNTAVLMVTHSPEHAAWGDRIAFLKNGMIAGELEQGARTNEVAPIFEKLLELDI